MHTSFVLIDFENVQPADLATLAQPHFKVMVFAGAHQARVPFDLAQALQRMGERAEYIKVSGNGPNALDFHIAFYIGQLAAANPGGSFHIVSKDKGFDPLIRHLKTKHIVASRALSVSDIPTVTGATPTSIEERVTRVISTLQSQNGGRPRTPKKLANAIAAMFQKQLAAEEITSIVDALQSDGRVMVAGNKVTYAFP